MPDDKTPEQKAVLKAALNAVEIGSSGLKEWGGYILEEWLTALWRYKWRRIVMEMRDNDPTVGATLRAVQLLCRQVRWWFDPGVENNLGRERAEYAEHCLFDMRDTWQDTLAEILTMLEWGFAAPEIVYKRRDGQEPGTYIDEKEGAERSWPRSKYDDGLVGWDSWAPRAQETVETWQRWSNGEIKSYEQSAPPNYLDVKIPFEKFLLFRPSARKANPEGTSVLRTAWLSWYYKTEIQRCEAIGIERELAGLPVIYIPQEYLVDGATAEQQAVADDFRKLVRNLRLNEHGGVLMPSVRDDKGNLLFELKLLSTGGQRAIDVDKSVQRHNVGIATSMLADVILLGHEKVGSYALASSKTNLLAVALGAYLDSICEVVNRYAIPRLWKLNGWPLDDTLPAFKHGDVEQVDLAELGEFISKLSGAGYSIHLDEEVQREVLNRSGLPVPKEMPDIGPELPEKEEEEDESEGAD